jgi:hypothetical protein
MAQCKSWEDEAMADRTDPRITRTEQAFEQATVELAARRPVSQITIADLADRAERESQAAGAA